MIHTLGQSQAVWGGRERVTMYHMNGMSTTYGFRLCAYWNQRIHIFSTK